MSRECMLGELEFVCFVFPTLSFSSPLTWRLSPGQYLSQSRTKVSVASDLWMMGPRVLFVMDEVSAMSYRQPDPHQVHCIFWPQQGSVPMTGFLFGVLAWIPDHLSGTPMPHPASSSSYREGVVGFCFLWIQALVGNVNGLIVGNAATTASLTLGMICSVCC